MLFKKKSIQDFIQRLEYYSCSKETGSDDVYCGMNPPEPETERNR